MIRSVRKEAGFTIMELLVVIGLIAVMSGIGIGMLRRRDSNLTTEVNGRLLRSILREARNSAKRAGAGVIVRLNRDANTVEASPMLLGGNWHFEDERGSRNTVIPGNLELAEEGWMGRAAQLSGTSVDLGVYPWYQATQAFRLRFRLKAAPDSNGVIVSRQNTFKLSLTEEGGLKGEVMVGKQHMTVETSTRGGLITPGHWHDVAFSFDRLEIILEVDGVRYAVKKEERPIAVDPKAHLVMGGIGFKGLIDELRYDVGQDGKVEEFAVGTDILDEGDLVIRFDANGRLDRRYHSKPATVLIEGDPPDDTSEPIRETIRIEFTGVIR